VGVTPGDLLAQSDPAKPFGHPGLPVPPGQPSVLQFQWLGHDLTDEHPWVE